MPASVARIMADLRREVHKYALVNEPNSLRDGEAASVSQLRRVQWVSSHLPLGWPVMTGNPFQRGATYLKKVIRRLLRWYINPIVDQQNQFNKVATDVIAEQHRKLDAVHENLAELQDELASAQRTIESLQKEIATLRDRALS
jgi:septal ring factor EnvC (AmiA/AmiB activator)